MKLARLSDTGTVLEIAVTTAAEHQGGTPEGWIECGDSVTIGDVYDNATGSFAKPAGGDDDDQ